MAALVNPRGAAPERESVTLLNTTADPVDLTGWSLADPGRRAVPLPGPVLEPGAAARIDLPPELPLGNSGGTLTLLDAAGLKVDGVAWTAEDAAEEGRTLVF